MTEIDHNLYLTEEWDYSPSLAKVCIDNFYGAIGVNGQVLMFETINPISPTWVHIPPCEDDWHPYISERMADMGVIVVGQGDTFPRGIDVRVADISWCADAPCGS